MYDLTTITTKLMTSHIFLHKQNLLTLHTQKGRGNIKLYLLIAWIIKYLISCWFSEDKFLHDEYICRKYLPWCHIKRMSLFRIFTPEVPKNPCHLSFSDHYTLCTLVAKLRYLFIQVVCYTRRPCLCGEVDRHSLHPFLHQHDQIHG